MKRSAVRGFANFLHSSHLYVCCKDNLRAFHKIFFELYLEFIKMKISKQWGIISLHGCSTQNIYTVANK